MSSQRSSSSPSRSHSNYIRYDSRRQKDKGLHTAYLWILSNSIKKSKAKKIKTQQTSKVDQLRNLNFSCKFITQRIKDWCKNWHRNKPDTYYCIYLQWVKSHHCFSWISYIALGKTCTCIMKLGLSLHRQLALLWYPNRRLKYTATYFV